MIKNTTQATMTPNIKFILKTKAMIDIKELRCSNLVKCNISNDAGIYQVVIIDKYSQKIGLDGSRYGEKIAIKKIKPIPITEEWLVRFGFDIVEATTTLFRKTLFTRFYIEYDEGKVYLDFNCKHYVEIELKYVHQLQNIFFTLTGKELKEIEK